MQPLQRLRMQITQATRGDLNLQIVHFPLPSTLTATALQKSPIVLLPLGSTLGWLKARSAHGGPNRIETFCTFKLPRQRPSTHTIQATPDTQYIKDAGLAHWAYSFHMLGGKSAVFCARPCRPGLQPPNASTKYISGLKCKWFFGADVGKT